LQALHAIEPTFCPVSIAYGQLEDSSRHFLLTEFVDVNKRNTADGSSLSFAKKLARVHNAPAATPQGHDRPKFGFHVTTFAGTVAQLNTYKESWATFYADNRLRNICNTIEEKYHGEKDLRNWIEKTVASVVPKLLGDGHLGGKKGIRPVLVHGDLWSGNQARGTLGSRYGVEEVAFDASCCYAHSEYELGLMIMFGGFSAGFFIEYHCMVPKTEPQNEYEDRMELYKV